MSAKELLKQNTTLFYKLEMNRTLDKIKVLLIESGQSRSLESLKPLLLYFRRLYYLGGFSDVLTLSCLASLAREFIIQVTEEGTIYSKEFLKILGEVVKRSRSIVEMIVEEPEEEGHFVTKGNSVILKPRLKKDVPIDDIVSLFKQWLITPEDVHRMHKLTIAKDANIAHTIKIPPRILNKRDKTCYLTLVYLDAVKTDDLDGLIKRLSSLEDLGDAVLQGPLDLPYNNFIESSAKRPFYLLLETTEPAEHYLDEQGVEARVIRVLKRPDPEALRDVQPKVVIKEVPYTAPEVLAAIKKITPVEEEEEEDETKAGSGDRHRIGKLKVRFSIGFKLIFIMSMIVLLSLSGLTFISTSAFLEKNKKAIDQDNLNNAKIMGDSIKEFFNARISAVNLLFLAGGLGDTEEAQAFLDQFFITNPDIIYIAVLGAERTEFMNEQYRAEITAGNIETLFISETDSLNRDYLDLPYVFNPSFLFNNVDEGRTVVIGVTAFSEVMGQPVLILVNVRDFMRTNFTESGLSTSYVINSDSQIILHSDPAIVTSSRTQQRNQIEDLVIVGETGPQGTEDQRITDFLFNIGSTPTQESAQDVSAYKQSGQNKLRITVQQQNTEGETEEVGVFQFLLRKIIGYADDQDFSDSGHVLEIMREIEQGRDLTLVLGAYQDIPFYRWLAEQLDRDKVNYYVYLKRVQGEENYNLGVVLEVEVDRINEAVNQTIRLNILIMVMVVSLSILALYFFSKTLTSPIQALVKAARKIESGEYDLKLKPRARDELGVLTGAFIDMGIGLEEKEQLKDAFGRFVNEEIAELAMKGELSLGGERKHATVFFSDIRSFTAISEKLEPEEVVGFLNEYMTLMVDCVKKNDGYVDKFIGDAIMALWGAPISHGSDEENCLNASLMMREVLIEFNKDRGTDRKPIIRIGCGINTGPVLAGQIGSTEKMEYTVIGDTVNLASRVEALNKPMGTDILITQQTADIVKDIYDLVPMNKIKVKGKAEPQQIYAVLGRKDNPSRPRSLTELRQRVGIEGDFNAIAEVDEKEVKYEIID